MTKPTALPLHQGPPHERPRPRPFRWLVESRLPAKVEHNVERICGSEDVRHVALMPDLHLGRLANNGTAVAHPSSTSNIPNRAEDSLANSERTRIGKNGFMEFDLPAVLNLRGE